MSFQPLTIRVRFKKQEGLSIRFSTFWGLLRYTARFPNKDEAWEEKTSFSGRQEKDKPKPKAHLPQKLPPLNRLIGIAARFLHINLWLIKHIRCKRFIWKTRVGFEDAAATGLTGGMLWGIKGFLFSILRRSINSGKCKAEISVTPVFCQQEIDTELDCIFTLPVGYIIIAGIRLIFLVIVSYPVLKGVRLHERPSN